MVKESQLATISPAQTSKRQAIPSSETIRQFLVEAGEVYGRQITAPLVAIWQRELGHIALPILRKAMHETLMACRFFPTVADVAQRIPVQHEETIFLGPRLLDYPKPELMTEQRLKEHNAEMIRFRRIIGPARRPRTSKEELHAAEQALGERETDPVIIRKIERQKAELLKRGMLSG